jgi:hypothetical protein
LLGTVLGYITVLYGRQLDTRSKMQENTFFNENVQIIKFLLRNEMA